MNKKNVVALGLLVICFMMVVPVFAAPNNAVGKNPKLSYVTAGEEEFLVLTNGAGVKKAWCTDGPNAGESFVYLDTDKLGIKAVEKKLAGDWTLSINTAPGFIYKVLKEVTQSPVITFSSAPNNAVGKNPNLYYLEYGADLYLIMNNIAGIKKAWCVDGPNAGDSFVYLDTSKLGEKAVEKKVAGYWERSISTAPGFIYKCLPKFMQRP